MSFPGGSEGKETFCKAGDDRDMELIPGLRRSPGEGHGNPLQYSCLENPMDRGGLEGYSHGVGKSLKQLKLLSRAQLMVAILSARNS